MTDHTTTDGSTAAAASPPVHDDVRAPGLAARSIAEGVGSFLVVLAGLGATMLATETALQPTLVFGFAVVAAMIAFGHVSGGHLNPAITLGSAVAGRTDWRSVVPYVVAQVLGAVAASGLIWLVLSANAQLTGIRGFFSSASNGYGEHSAAQFPLTSAFLLEVVAAALLVAVFLGAGSRGARRDLAPFAVGLTYAGLLSFLLPVTNGGINPIRSAASAVFAEAWALEQLWLFWVAPIVGALIAGLVFRSTDSWGPARRDGTQTSASEAPASAADRTALQDGALQDGALHDGALDEAGTGAERPAGDAASFFDQSGSDSDRGSSRDEAPGTSGPVRQPDPGPATH
jgi:aquaporin Z